jgi:hypothetical protein
MTTFSLNTLSDRDFALALRDDLWARDLNALTAVVRAGTHAYDKMNGEGEDREHTVIPGIGWVGLQLDESMGEWDATIVERERG